MHEEKIQKLETEIEELKKYIKVHKNEIKKREKILAMTIDEEIEVEIETHKEDIESYKEQIKYKKQLLRNYKKL